MRARSSSGVGTLRLRALAARSPRMCSASEGRPAVRSRYREDGDSASVQPADREGREGRLLADHTAVEGRDDPGQAAEHLARVQLLQPVKMGHAVEDRNNAGSRPDESANLAQYAVERGGFDPDEDQIEG
jgi:hypothetical protein